MKKPIIISAILLFVQIATFAQTPAATSPTNSTNQTSKSDKGRGKGNKMSAADRAVQYSNQLKTGLGLSDDQYQKVLAVNTECITRKDAMKGGGGDQKTGKGDIKAYRLGEFQKIFTATQMTTYQKMNQDNGGGKDSRDNNGGGRGKYTGSRDSTNRKGNH